MLAALGCHQIKALWCLRRFVLREDGGIVLEVWGWTTVPTTHLQGTIMKLFRWWNSCLKNWTKSSSAKCWLQVATYNSLPDMNIWEYQTSLCRYCISIMLHLSSKEWNPVDLTLSTTQNLFQEIFVSYCYKPSSCLYLCSLDLNKPSKKEQSKLFHYGSIQTSENIDLLDLIECPLSFIRSLVLIDLACWP